MGLFPTVVNMLAVTCGALLGLVLRRGLPEGLRLLVMQAIGLAVMVIGLRMALQAPNDVIVVVGLTLGAIIGYVLKLDDRLNRLGYLIKKWVRVSDSNFVDGLVTASLIYCVGAMAIVGSFEAALNHNYDVLYVKSSLDGIVSIVLGSTMGVGVAFSGIFVLLYQGFLTLTAGLLEPILTESVVGYMSASGGVLIMAIGMGVAGIKEVKTANLLPGIFIAAIIGYFF